MTTLTIGYWKIRGLAQVIRLLLSYTNTPFQEVFYEFQTKEKWFEQDKNGLGFDFPNIPYLIDGQLKLTESHAIAKYIIHKSGNQDLLGKDKQDQGTVQSILGVINDIFKELRGLFGNPNYQTVKGDELEKVRPKIEYLRNFVGDKKFALGYLTLVDFQLAQNLYYFQTLFPTQRRNFGFWWKIRHHFEQLPGVKIYYQRDNAVKYPFIPPFVPLQPQLLKVKLAYWAIRGLAQVPRLLLSYSGVKFQDYIYTHPEKWFKDDKLHLGLDFPNIPYLIDQDYNITQSAAIQRYIIKKWGKKELLGKDIKDSARLDSFLSVFIEASGAIKALFFNKEHETAKKGVLEKYQVKFQQLNKFVGEKQFILGYLSLADFVVAQDSHYIERVFPQQYKKWSFLQQIRENFNKFPEIVSYYQLPTAFNGRFFPEYAALSVEQ